MQLVSLRLNKRNPCKICKRAQSVSSSSGCCGSDFFGIVVNLQSHNALHCQVGIPTVANQQ